MIDLQALKEQLKLLGHNLPDSQVIAILKEMNIDYEGIAEDQSDVAEESTGPAEGWGRDERSRHNPPRTGSILDSFHGRPQNTAGPNAAVAAVPYGYTHQPSMTGGRLGYTGAPQASTTSRARPFSTVNDESDEETDIVGEEDSDDDYDDDDPGAHDQGPTCRPCLAVGPGQLQASRRAATGEAPTGGTFQAWAEPAVASSAGQTLLSVESRAREPVDPAESLGRLSLGMPAQRQGPTGAKSSLPVTARMGAFSAPLLAGTSPAAASGDAATSSGHGHHAAGTHFVSKTDQVGRAWDLGDDESDVFSADSRRGLPEPGASLRGQGRKPGTAQHAPPVCSGIAAGRSGVAGTAAHGLYHTAWLDGNYGRPQRVDAGHADGELPTRSPLSPQESTRSLVSRSSTVRGSKSAVRKVDRVQRYQQLQQEWSQNRFLKQAGGTTRSTARKPVNFHNHFAQLHAAEEAERQRMLRDARAKTKKELSGATDAPTDNRRDELRWQTRMRLKAQG